jgi:hypothetical protein
MSAESRDLLPPGRVNLVQIDAVVKRYVKMPMSGQSLGLGPPACELQGSGSSL